MNKYLKTYMLYVERLNKQKFLNFYHYPYVYDKEKFLQKYRSINIKLLHNEILNIIIFLIKNDPTYFLTFEDYIWLFNTYPKLRESKDFIYLSKKLNIDDICKLLGNPIKEVREIFKKHFDQPLKEMLNEMKEKEGFFTGTASSFNKLFLYDPELTKIFK